MHLCFTDVREHALPLARPILQRLLPNGRECGHEWVALNPKRPDRNHGSFKVNLRTGRWADFATGDRGGDLISLYAYLDDCSQLEAAKAIARFIGRPW